jgi:hypothetical protein
MYNPVGGGDAEFIEIGNIGPVAVDLGAVRLAGGIEFAFGGSDVTSLAPGERAVVVKDSRAFSFFYDAAGMKVAGEYRGRLDNAGDEIILALGEYSVIQQFRYESTWYPDTNGEGYSLVTVAPAGPSEKWSSKDGWRPSADLLGSPGAAEPDDPAAGGPRLPSDFDGDGTLNLTDAVNLLSVLYLDSPPPLPCGEPAGEAGGAAAGGSTALLDANGDRRLNLTDAVHVLNYLYLNGAPPTLGTACRRIAGCPEACGG